MKIGLYLRVSTDKQVEGEGLDVQEDACRKWARANRHQVVAVYRDEGISGADGLENRLALADALGAVRDGASKGIVVYRLDRLARDLVLQEQLLAEVRRLGGQVFSTSAGEAGYLEDDPDDPSRKLIRRILGAVNDYERDMIALRLRSGRRAKAARGGFAYGSPAYGTRAEDGALVVNEDEHATVALILELADEGESLRGICEKLTAKGRRTKRGKSWHPQTVARIIQGARRSAA